ncbi:unnamed protein product [Urochloa humidicola]
MANVGDHAATDGFSATHLFSQAISHTYYDLIFLPCYIDIPADAIDLTTRLSLLHTPCAPPLRWTPSLTPPWPPLAAPPSSTTTPTLSPNPPHSAPPSHAASLVACLNCHTRST